MDYTEQLIKALDIEFYRGVPIRKDAGFYVVYGKEYYSMEEVEKAIDDSFKWVEESLKKQP